VLYPSQFLRVFDSAFSTANVNKAHRQKMVELYPVVKVRRESMRVSVL